MLFLVAVFLSLLNIVVLSTIDKLRNNVNFSKNDLENQDLFIKNIFYELFDKNNLILARTLYNRSLPDTVARGSILFETFVRCHLYKGTELKNHKTT